MPLSALHAFLRWESAGGALLLGGAVLAMVVANSPLADVHDALLHTRTAIVFGPLSIDKPLLLWINDGLMAVFFLLIGLELKREVLEGQLASREQLALPVLGALGGFALPALIYVLVNRGDPIALEGWAIPSATDIAFALGVLTALGSRVPIALKVFLASLAIVDDLGAILVIAVFYTADLSLVALGVAAAGAVVLAALNLAGVTRIAVYVVVGVIVWVAVLKSGVHATLAGVMVAFAIPLRVRGEGHSPLRHLEHTLHPWIAFAILPLFAYANAGVRLDGISAEMLFGGVSLGIAAGLFLGKQIGVFVPVWLAIRSGFVRMPEGASWASLYGVAVLTGVGFTMSFFIGTLAFENADRSYEEAMKLGVLLGSSASVLLGYAVLRLTARAPAAATREDIGRSPVPQEAIGEARP